VCDLTEYAPAKLGTIPLIFLNFQKLNMLQKYLKDNRYNSLYLVQKAQIFGFGPQTDAIVCVSYIHTRHTGRTVHFA